MDRVSKSLATARARLSSSALLHNFRVLEKRANGLELIPMIKANGYGHGDAWVAQTLRPYWSRLRGFGVATTEEGIALRSKIRSRVPIIVFSGTPIWTEEKAQAMRRSGLEPVVSTWDDLKRFLGRGDDRRLRYHLKFNTGINRLGIPLDQVRATVDLLLRKKAILPETILSHLAVADDPNRAASRRQHGGARELLKEWTRRLPERPFHFGNSAALWFSKGWKLQTLSQIARPGISLYGAAPRSDIASSGLRPVMTLEAQTVHQMELRTGDIIGYGAQFRVGKQSPRTARRFAILGAGYADGIHRQLSGRGLVYWKGKTCPVVGRVSMDLMAFAAPRSLAVGSWVEIFGPHLLPWVQAERAGTIPYELFTSVGTRVARYYE